ncbi:MAG: tRNA 2-thiouridine(34) synthase MnmA [Candidatus Calescibacterium sp.]|nr:tRNA 2-thiouridine(34) synthase MnmA [Candidatus Calescibacterium sp.]MCX7972207.1 tRNA 2-thiouridine(34) synthase MnmA [bacterium]MDW8194897.1 tRNA 2-thiouridine(34) synthase MnmA [Candidatus Calescibacterium sp.]
MNTTRININTVNSDFKKEYETFLASVSQEFSKIGIKSNSTIAIGLSGGVDSSSTLAILKELGYNVVGITMKIWNEKYSKFFPDTETKIHGCFGPEEYQDIKDAEKVCKTLKVPFYSINLSDQYEQIVLEYFKNEYLRGRTPNPCVICNWKMKFEYLLTKASESGIHFDYFATGHYVKRSVYKNHITLAKANYIQKDQSYYLSYLNKSHIEKSIFPLGYIQSKNLTREISKYYGLEIYNKPDSQNFISIKYTELFKGYNIENGIIVHKNGKVLGKHQGIHLYTIGQRKGLNISSSKPLYVINIDSKNNLIVVGEKEDLYQKKLIAKNINWLVKEFNGISAKIRYTHEPAPCKIKEIEEDTIEVEFEQKQLAITPGQIIAFYKDDILLGAGIIHTVIIGG